MNTVGDLWPKGVWPKGVGYNLSEQIA